MTSEGGVDVNPGIHRCVGKIFSFGLNAMSHKNSFTPIKDNASLKCGIRKGILTAKINEGYYLRDVQTQAEHIDTYRGSNKICT
ncbi:MAG: hypothetical protein COV47_01755 [Candidatus Diapherotrites archaeon CG11_big_fil_rev_8_21_14_0_20_37_9]|nr:MAG: hypothetical protein COV47_01755 [Candidatus Diapherotrites archaeon CG11_big_fil_rev_8_21_14_0_20_37_9]